MFLLNAYTHERLSELRQQQLVKKARNQRLLNEAQGFPVERIVEVLTNVRGLPSNSRQRDAAGRNPGRPISTPEG
ncbi:MAG: hypothetical protein AB7N24_03560 [Dehalococcoidia bacterium]